MSENLTVEHDKSSGDVGPFKGGAFILYVTAFSGIAGFGLTIARARKSSPNDFAKLNNEGTKLAVKALAYGTAISVTGCGLLAFGVGKAFGVSSTKGFGRKMKEVMPAKDGEFVHKFDDWPTKLPNKPDDGKWREDFK